VIGRPLQDRDRLRCTVFDLAEPLRHVGDHEPGAHRRQEVAQFDRLVLEGARPVEPGGDVVRPVPLELDEPLVERARRGGVHGPVSRKPAPP
jgi:hypothetical protein